MRILTPGPELNILVGPVVTNADTVFQYECRGLRSGRNKHADENIKTVPGLNSDIGSIGSRRSINIDYKWRFGSTHEADGRNPDGLAIIIYQFNLLGNRTCGCENRIKTHGIGGKKKKRVSIQTRLFLAGKQHNSGTKTEKQDFEHSDKNT